LAAPTVALLDLRPNSANVIVRCPPLGLGVIGPIRVVTRWPEEAFSDIIALISTPRAVLFSAPTTIASSGSLAVSKHLGLARMGLLLTSVILWNLDCTLVILPSVLALADQ
jgi:predicted RND superfamily exporter protein